jgi:hypothetical protein
MYYKKSLENTEVVTPVEIDDDEGNGAGYVTIGAGEGESKNDDKDAVVMIEGDENNETLDEVDNTAQQDEQTESVVTKSGRAVVKPTRLIEEMGAAAYNEIGLSAAEEKYYTTMWKMNEFALVGAGVGGGFVDTNELHVMKYREAMAGKDVDEWQKAVKEEHDKIIKHQVWKPVPVEDLPPGSKVLSSTWAMKKKANGNFRARLNARGFEQIDGVHYDESTKAAPVESEIVIRLVMILIVMAGWWAELLDVQGAFLTGEMDPDTICYLHVPEGFERFYPKNVVLRLCSIRFLCQLWPLPFLPSV